MSVTKLGVFALIANRYCRRSGSRYRYSKDICAIHPRPYKMIGYAVYSVLCIGMARTNTLPIRLTDLELAKLKAEAERQGVSMSEVVRAWINILLEPKTK